MSVSRTIRFKRWTLDLPRSGESDTCSALIALPKQRIRWIFLQVLARAFFRVMAPIRILELLSPATGGKRGAEFARPANDPFASRRHRERPTTTLVAACPFGPPLRRLAQPAREWARIAHELILSLSDTKGRRCCRGVGR